MYDPIVERRLLFYHKALAQDPGNPDRWFFRAATACCANPCPQLMVDKDKGIVLQCMNCSAFVG